MKTYKNPWLRIYGVGVNGYAGLDSAGKDALGKACQVFTSKRLLATLPHALAERAATWQRPLSLSLNRIVSLAGTHVVVLASGDPLHHGIGAALASRVPRADLLIIPGVSVFSEVAARMGWSLVDTGQVSLHQDDPSAIRRQLAPSRRLIVLTRDGKTPRAVAQHLTDCGYGASEIVIWSDVGGRQEAALHTTAQAITKNLAKNLSKNLSKNLAKNLAQKKGQEKSPNNGQQNISDLNTLAITCTCRARDGVSWACGLPIDAFAHDGTITKPEVRAATLARLAPMPGGLLWDVGAGCGSVAIEWARCAPGARAVAIEPREDRCAMISRNCQMLGTPQVQIIKGRAPEVLADLPLPDAIFIGGGVMTPGLVTAARQALVAGGRLVANAVTLEGQERLASLYQEWGGELVQIAVSTVRPVGRRIGWTPGMGVWQWCWRKP